VNKNAKAKIALKIVFFIIFKKFAEFER